MTVVCLVILAGIFWGDFFLKNYIESHVDERDEREICRGKLLIRKHHNKGMMLNAGQKRRRLVAAVSLAFTLILTVVFIVSLGHRGNNCCDWDYRCCLVVPSAIPMTAFAEVMWWIM